MGRILLKKGRDIKWLIQMVWPVAVVLAIMMCVFPVFRSYLNATLYTERLTQMNEVTGELFYSLENVVKLEWYYTQLQKNYLEEATIESVDELTAFMEEQNRLQEMDHIMSSSVAVSEKGHYYTANGKEGLLHEMEAFTQEKDRISFVTNDLTTDDSYMFFLIRLTEPLVIREGNDTTTLNCYGVRVKMDGFNPYFQCDAYQNQSSVYVIDKNGAKLFSSTGQQEPIRGYNVFAALKAVGRKEWKMDERGRSYNTVILNGHEYFYALYHMQEAEWLLTYFVPAEYVAVSTVNMVNTITKIFMVVAVMVTLLAAVFFNIKLKQVHEKNHNQRLRELNIELEKAMKAADNANRAKSNFLANMSHDIRTPMNAIVGITTLMNNETNLSDKMQDYVHKIHLSSQYLLSLINDVLDMSKIEAEEAVLAEEPFILTEQIAQVEKIIQGQTFLRGQRFSFRTQKIYNSYVMGDSVRLRQILLNLLSNSAKYTPEGGEITMEFEELPCQQEGKAKFRFIVTDNGRGMTPEFLEHIFEPFVRSEDSVTNKIQGTGLGMAITKNFVDLMGGQIQIESTLNQGTRSVVTLELNIDRNANYPSDAERVLLVTGEEILRFNVERLFDKNDATVCCVATEEEAVGLLKEQSFDVILFTACYDDPHLPEVVARLRENGDPSTMIFCMDFPRENWDNNHVQESGVDGIISRPFSMNDMNLAISRARSTAGTQEFSALKGVRFLCAEDNIVNVEILRAILEMNGARCTIYSNGAELVEAFEQVKPDEYDVILMDIQMPVMNGLEATRAIREGKNPLGKTIPIIAMTANAFTEDIQQSMEAGMNAHISKPLDTELLEKVVGSLRISRGQSNCHKM